MNNRGQIWFAYAFVIFLLFLTLFALIDPFKVNLDANRSYASGMNCPNSADFNSTAYAQQGFMEKLTRRPTCFVTGISMVWFVFAVLIAGLIWLFNQGGKK